jgi:hypothetical protein
MIDEKRASQTLPHCFSGPGRCFKLGFPHLLTIIIKSVEFGGESKSPLKNVTSTKIPDIRYVQKLF